MASGKTASVKPGTATGDRYMELVRLFPLRPIRSHAELDRANDVAGRLAERGTDTFQVVFALYTEDYQ